MVQQIDITKMTQMSQNIKKNIHMDYLEKKTLIRTCKLIIDYMHQTGKTISMSIFKDDSTTWISTGILDCDSNIIFIEVPDRIVQKMAFQDKVHMWCPSHGFITRDQLSEIIDHIAEPYVESFHIEDILFSKSMLLNYMLNLSNDDVVKVTFISDNIATPLPGVHHINTGLAYTDIACDFYLYVIVPRSSDPYF